MSLAQISILGCGWLGFPLAVSLRQKGYRIKGSTTSKEKTEDLKSAGIVPFLIRLNAEKTVGEIDSFLNGSQLLIINIPPGMRGNSPGLFSSKIEKIIPFIEKSTLEKVLFVGSISVFGDGQGVVDEDTRPEPDSTSGKGLLKTEMLLRSNPHFKTTVLRFGGLVGEDRHPVFYLSGKTNLKGGNAPVNLIHQKDCIGIIEQVVQSNLWGKIIHGVQPFFQTKKEYYTTEAGKRKLPLPVFADEENKSFKHVKSVVLERLNYSFREGLTNINS